MATALAELEPLDFTEQLSPHVAWANALVIQTPEQFAGAAERLKAVKALQKEIEGSYGPLKQKASEAHKAIVAEEKKQLAPLLRAESVCKSVMLNYQRAEDEKRDAERRRLQAEADERARKEREAALKKAAAAKKPETQARYQEQAAQIIAPVVQVATASPKVDGLTTRKEWKFRIVDATKIPREYLAVDEKKIGQYARMMKEQANIEGIQFYSETNLAASGR